MANLSEVYFYHVTKQTVVSALPQLLAKSIDVGWTVFIKGKDEASLKLFDDAIWTAQPESFIPHAVIGSQNENKCDILLGTEENDSSNSDFLISVNGALISVQEISRYLGEPEIVRLCQPMAPKLPLVPLIADLLLSKS